MEKNLPLTPPLREGKIASKCQPTRKPTVKTDSSPLPFTPLVHPKGCGRGRGIGPHAPQKPHYPTGSHACQTPTRQRNAPRPDPGRAQIVGAAARRPFGRDSLSPPANHRTLYRRFLLPPGRTRNRSRWRYSFVPARLRPAA